MNIQTNQNQNVDQPQSQPVEKFKKKKVSKLAEARKSEVDNARKVLLEKVFPFTTTVYCVLRKISASGMFRRIDFYAFVPSIAKDPSGKDYLNPAGERVATIDKWYLTGYFDVILNDGEHKARHDGLGVSGCGMDMGFHIVNTISSILYRNPDGSYSHDGAYKLQSEWI